MYILAIEWGVLGIKAAQLLLSLSILVILHEFGHYITARWFKCRVEKFYLFFDPWFSIFKKKVGDTEYGIGWLPLGGYVKISGMIDESMDKSQLSAPPEPWEFRSKPAWQRLIIMIGGVTVNVLVAFIVYAGILMYFGETKVPASSVKYGISIQDSVMYELGLRDGDKILEANGKEIEDYNKVFKRVIVAKKLTIERDGKNFELELPVNMLGTLVEKKRGDNPLFSVRVPAIISDLDTGMSAYKAGLKAGDKIVSVDGDAVFFFDELKRKLNQKNGKIAKVEAIRGNDTISFELPVSQDGKLGIIVINTTDEFKKYGVMEAIHKKYGFWEAIPGGVRLAINELEYYFESFKLIFQPSTGAYKGVGGFKSMGSIFSPTWDWERFWNITAFFSIVLAFMNMLPIPALDGGHVVFTLIEMITGRKPNQKFLEVAQIIGMVLLLGLMLYANGNDFFGWGKGR